MLGYIARRFALAPVVAFGVLFLVFMLMHLIPGDPVDAMLGESASMADREALRAQLHLTDPLPVQFVYFLRGLARDELKSIYYNEPVWPRIGKRFVATAQLAAAALLISLAISLPFGIAAAVKRGKALDAAAMAFSLLGVSMPGFWLGPMLILVFSIKLGWLPVSGTGGLSHLVLPAVTLGAGMAAIVSRMTRGSLLDALGEDYLRTARAKGLSEPAVILKHALRNALIPTVSVVGLQAGALLSGAIITETIFAWPGLGSLIISAINTRDYPLVQASVIAISLSYVIINLLTDVVYAAVDPRVRFGEKTHAE